MVVHDVVSVWETFSLNVFKDLAIDPLARVQLLAGEIAFRMCAGLKVIFPFVDDALLIKEHGRIGVQAFADICPDALDSRKDQIGAETEEAFDAAIPDLGSFPVERVGQDADLNDRCVTA